MKKVLYGLILFFAIGSANAETAQTPPRIIYHAACYSVRNSQSAITEQKYRAASERCATGMMRTVYSEKGACLTKAELSTLAQAACDAIPIRPAHPPIVKSPQPPVMRPIDPIRPKPQVQPPVVTQPPPQPPIVRSPVTTEPPKIPSAPVQPPIVIQPPSQPPVVTQPPASNGVTAPAPSSTGGGGGGRTIASEPKPEPQPVPPASVPPTGQNPTDGGVSTNTGSATTLAYSGSFYSVRTDIKYNSTAKTAEVIYSDVSAASGMMCSSNRYVLNLDLTNPSNLAFVNTNPPTGSFQTVSLRCPSAPLIKSSGYDGGLYTNTKTVNYPLGCIVDSALAGGPYRAPNCAIP
jgi:hypothetical protein